MIWCDTVRAEMDEVGDGFIRTGLCTVLLHSQSSLHWSGAYDHTFTGVFCVRVYSHVFNKAQLQRFFGMYTCLGPRVNARPVRHDNLRLIMSAVLQYRCICVECKNFKSYRGNVFVCLRRMAREESFAFCACVCDEGIDRCRSASVVLCITACVVQ